MAFYRDLSKIKREHPLAVHRHSKLVVYNRGDGWFQRTLDRKSFAHQEKAKEKEKKGLLLRQFRIDVNS